MRILVLAIAALALSGCNGTNEVKPDEWKEGPFARVVSWKRAYPGGETLADVWVEVNEGDKLKSTPSNILGQEVKDVYILRKNSGRWSLPLEVHDPNRSRYSNTIPIACYHAMVGGKEVDFLTVTKR